MAWDRRNKKKVKNIGKAGNKYDGTEAAAVRRKIGMKRRTRRRVPRESREADRIRSTKECDRQVSCKGN